MKVSEKALECKFCLFASVDDVILVIYGIFKLACMWRFLAAESSSRSLSVVRWSVGWLVRPEAL